VLGYQGCSMKPVAQLVLSVEKTVNAGFGAPGVMTGLWSLNFQDLSKHG
jgi:hypothetical protein